MCEILTVPKCSVNSFNGYHVKANLIDIKDTTVNYYLHWID